LDVELSYSLDDGLTWLNDGGATTTGGSFLDKNGITLRLPAFGGGVPVANTVEIMRLTVTASTSIVPPDTEWVIETFS
jgi:hypothetical protein